MSKGPVVMGGGGMTKKAGFIKRAIAEGTFDCSKIKNPSPNIVKMCEARKPKKTKIKVKLPSPKEPEKPKETEKPKEPKSKGPMIRVLLPKKDNELLRLPKTSDPMEARSVFLYVYKRYKQKNKDFKDEKLEEIFDTYKGRGLEPKVPTMEGRMKTLFGDISDKDFKDWAGSMNNTKKDISTQGAIREFFMKVKEGFGSK